MPRARGPKQVSAPSFARVSSRLVPRACFRALSRRINRSIQLYMGTTWARPASETQDGDVDGDGGRHAPAEGSPLESGSTERGMASSCHPRACKSATYAPMADGLGHACVYVTHNRVLYQPCHAVQCVRGGPVCNWYLVSDVVLVTVRLHENVGPCLCDVCAGNHRDWPGSAKCYF